MEASDHMALQTDWHDFYDAVEDSSPHDSLLKALTVFDQGAEFDQQSVCERFAIDLGCGSGRDTLEMLRRGWRVLAIDFQAEGIERLQKRVIGPQRSRLQTRVAPFEDLHDLPECDFINASYSLPFCTPTHFDALWEMIVRAIQAHGRFAGTFFGGRDSWAQKPGMTFHTRAQVETLLEPFEVEQLLEEDSDGKTALGETKHWHTFEVVAFKREKNRPVTRPKRNA
jgi:tellurite methyltransferase